MSPNSEKAVLKIVKTLSSMKVSVPGLTASTLNHYLDQLDRCSSDLTDIFISEGRGLELPSETFEMSDPLALIYQDLTDFRATLRNEISRRYGPGAPSRLPTRQRK
jgi:hypothetical protein